jgi:hypothetical protein
MLLMIAPLIIKRIRVQLLFRRKIMLNIATSDFNLLSTTGRTFKGNGIGIESKFYS